MQQHPKSLSRAYISSGTQPGGSFVVRAQFFNASRFANIVPELYLQYLLRFAKAVPHEGGRHFVNEIAIDIDFLHFVVSRATKHKQCVWLEGCWQLSVNFIEITFASNVHVRKNTRKFVKNKYGV